MKQKEKKREETERNRVLLCSTIKIAGYLIDLLKVTQAKRNSYYTKIDFYYLSNSYVMPFLVQEIMTSIDKRYTSRCLSLLFIPVCLIVLYIN